MATPPAGPHVSWSARCAGAAAATIAWLAVRCLRFDRTVWLVQHLVSGTGRRLATAREAEAMLRAIDEGAAWLPMRVACLERSLAAVLLAAGWRRAITWCYGVRARPPLTMHAWISTPTGPVGEREEHIAARRIAPRRKT
ncbi:lasso peptide biosynthesis B2 protein [Saccharopolyspora phatthalungensis]|nr:lasso peptide biosynthesis B2 protein [Saccharopolyspora phatthalungensis]